MKKELKIRLLESISIDSKTGCWNWVKGKSYGYGRMFVGSKLDNTRKNAFAHRVSFSVFKSAVPINMCVLHKCDNPACINPDHLFLGTYKDNTKDMDNKGRRGLKMRGGTIDIQMAVLIKKDLLTTKMIKVARKHKVPYHIVKDIAKGRSWKHAKVTFDKPIKN